MGVSSAAAGTSKPACSWLGVEVATAKAVVSPNAQHQPRATRHTRQVISVTRLESNYFTITDVAHPPPVQRQGLSHQAAQWP